MDISLIITAGGTGSRYGNRNKLLEKVNGKTIIEYCVERFSSFKEIPEIVIPANKEIIPEFEKLFKNNPKIKIIEGGENRQKSVYNALKSLNNPDYVLIHDGARPLVKAEDIKKVIDKTISFGAAILAVKTIDTIKMVDENGKIIKTVDRSNLYNVQTPQGFKYSLIYEAHKKLAGENFTDDSGMLEALKKDVYIVEGDYSNFKITTKYDTERMKTIIDEFSNNH